MHFLIKREDLVVELGKVGNVVERRQTLPILGNLLLGATDGRVEIVGTDLELEIGTQMPAQVEAEGSITVPARKFVDICRAFPANSLIEVKLDKERIAVKTGRSRFVLNSLPSSDYPRMGAVEGAFEVAIDRDRLKDLLGRTAFAMAAQDVRYYLNGMLWELDGERFVGVATDGHRLALAEEQLKEPVDAATKVIVPRKTIGELLRILGGDDEVGVRVLLSSRSMVVEIGSTRLQSKLIDGRYPDYQGVIPQAPERQVSFDREIMRQALVRAAILSNEKYKGISIGFRPGLVHLKMQNPELDEGEEDVEVDYTGEPISIGFNVGYLVDVLNVIDRDTVEMRFSNANSSAVLRGAGAVGETFVVMPMRL